MGSILGEKKDKSWTAKQAEVDSTSISPWVIVFTLAGSWVAVLIYWLISRDGTFQAKRNFQTSWQLAAVLTALGLVVSACNAF